MDFQAADIDLPSDEADVRLAIEHGGDDFPAGALAQVDPGLRVQREELAQRLRQVSGQRGGVGLDADIALDALGVVVQIALEVFQLLQHPARMLQQRLARGGRGDAGGAAVQQLGADVALQLLDAPAGRGKRNATVFRTLGEAGFVGDVNEELEVE
ncbi:hypothetical protein D9M71_106180 [compost metagenome]